MSLKALLFKKKHLKNVWNLIKVVESIKKTKKLKKKKKKKKIKKIKKKKKTYDAIKVYINYFVFAIIVFFKLIVVFFNCFSINAFANIIVNVIVFDFVII